TFALRALGQNVIINEVMYHPASENLLASYVELYNRGTSPVNLSGWRFVTGLQFAFPTNTLIGPGGYLVVAADRSAFTNKYPGVPNLVAGWPTPMGSHLQLVDAAEQVISEVNYSNDGDWASRVLTSGGPNSYGHAGWDWDAPHDGRGSSLELINPALP